MGKLRAVCIGLLFVLLAQPGLAAPDQHAMERGERRKSFSEDERARVTAARLRFQDRLDELNGRGGYPGVADEDLELFAAYVLEELEQASLNDAILWTMYIGFFVLCGALLLLFVLA